VRRRVSSGTPSASVGYLAATRPRAPLPWPRARARARPEPLPGRLPDDHEESSPSAALPCSPARPDARGLRGSASTPRARMGFLCASFFPDGNSFAAERVRAREALARG